MGKPVLVFTVSKAAQIPHDEQGVLIDRVHVEQVVLHAPHDIAESRYECREQAIAVHALQLRVHAFGLLQQLQKEMIDLLTLTERVVHQVQVIANGADGRRGQPPQALIPRQHHEQFHQRRGPPDEDGLAGRLQIPIPDLELLTQLTGGGLGAG